MRRATLLFLSFAACGASSKPAEPPTPAPAAATAAPAPAGPLVIPKASGAGKIETRTFHSDALGVDKKYVVYLPGSYGADPTARWPVLYYLNGLGGDETNWTQAGDLEVTADQLGLAAIVVMPDGDDGFYANSVTPRDYDACMKDGTGLFDAREDHATECVRKADYEDYIIKDLVPTIDRTFATAADRRARGIAGFSMGGFGALELAMRHTDLFSAAASHSGVDALLYVGPHPYEAGKAQLIEDVATWGRVVEPIGGWVRAIFGPDRANWEAHDPAVLATKLAPGTLALYLDCGTEDVFGLDAEAAYLHDVLTAHKIEHSYYEGPGRHDFSFWKPRLSHSLVFFTAHFAGQPAPAETAAPAAPMHDVTILRSIASKGAGADMVEHLIEGVAEGAKQCAASTNPSDGVRELAIGVTDDAHLADARWLGVASPDAFDGCLVQPQAATPGTVRYLYVAFAITSPGAGAPAAPPAPDRAHDLEALCHGSLDVRDPDVLALAHDLAQADAKQKRALLHDALAASKISAKTCPLAK